MNQVELQRMAKERLLDVEALIAGSRWEFAYYAAGHAVECSLKSCLRRRMVLTGWVFKDDVKDVLRCGTHDFLALIQIAGMMDELNDRLRESSEAGDEFAANWNILKQWKVTSRYEANSETEARRIYAAITADRDGVLKWIKNYW